MGQRHFVKAIVIVGVVLIAGQAAVAQQNKGLFGFVHPLDNSANNTDENSQVASSNDEPVTKSKKKKKKKRKARPVRRGSFHR